MPADMSAAADKAEEVGDSRPVEALARMGLVAYGFVHIVVGCLALAIAWAHSPAPADTSGAMRTVAAQPFGRVSLFLASVSLLGLALWQLSEAIWGYRDRKGMKRRRKQIGSAGKAVLYASLGVSAASFAFGHNSDNSQQQQHRTSGVLSWTGGRTLVILAGAFVIGIGINSIRRGVTASFRKELNLHALPEPARETFVRLGQIGHLAKGAALCAVGAVLAYAAWTFDPAESRGLDGALRKMVDKPGGPIALSAVALGLIAFGLFAIAQSRYRKM